MACSPSTLDSRMAGAPWSQLRRRHCFRRVRRWHRTGGSGWRDFRKSSPGCRTAMARSAVSWRPAAHQRQHFAKPLAGHTTGQRRGTGTRSTAIRKNRRFRMPQSCAPALRASGRFDTLPPAPIHTSIPPAPSALHPGSGSPRKNWPFPRWVEVMTILQQAHPRSAGSSSQEKRRRRACPPCAPLWMPQACIGNPRTGWTSFPGRTATSMHRPARPRQWHQSPRRRLRGAVLSALRPHRSSHLGSCGGLGAGAARSRREFVRHFRSARRRMAARQAGIQPVTRLPRRSFD